MKLTPQHYKAIELLAMGGNNKSVAERLDIAPETVSRWRSDFEFQAAMNKIIDEAQKTAKDRLRHLSGVALETIENVLLDKETPPRDRMTAAFKILELTQVSAPKIGSTNARVLKAKKEENDLFEIISSG